MNTNEIIEEALKDFDDSFVEMIFTEDGAKYIGKFTSGVSKPIINKSDLTAFIKKSISTALERQREEIINEVKSILTDEIATAHTSESGKTSRLTSAYNRVDALIRQTEI